MDPEPLKCLGKPSIYVYSGTESELSNYAIGLRENSVNRVEAKTLRGSKMGSINGLFDEMSAALQFPYYFMPNWDSFDECITDLSWLPATAYTLIFTCTDLIAPDDDYTFKMLLRTLEAATEEWAELPSLNLPEEIRSGRPRPFHSIFHAVPERFDSALGRIRRLSSNGGEVQVISEYKETEGH